MNFTDILAEALGRGGHPDYYRLYKAGGPMDEAVAAARRFLQDNGVRVGEEAVEQLQIVFNQTVRISRVTPKRRCWQRW